MHITEYIQHLKFILPDATYDILPCLHQRLISYTDYMNTPVVINDLQSYMKQLYGINIIINQEQTMRLNYILWYIHNYRKIDTDELNHMCLYQKTMDDRYRVLNKLTNLLLDERRIMSK